MAGTKQLPLIAVTGSERPYIYDLPHLLSLPEGFEFRFRYRHKWVESQLTGILLTHPENLQGKELIVLFHSQQTKRLIPLRKCTIISVENIGPMIFLRFRVGAFPVVEGAPFLSSDWEAATAAAEALSEIGRGLLGDEGKGRFDLENALPEHFYFRTAKTVPTDLQWSTETKAPKVSADWERLAVCLLREPNLAEIPMFQILGFQREDGKFEEPREVKEFNISGQSIRGFRLVEGARYRLRLVEWCEPPLNSTPKSLKIRPEFRTDVLELEGASNLVVGRYDVIEITFKALRPGYTELAIRAEPVEAAKQSSSEKIAAELAQIPKVPEKTPQEAMPTPRTNAKTIEKNTDWPEIFSVRVPIRVRNKVRRVVAAGIVAGAGCLVYGIAPTYFPNDSAIIRGFALLLTYPILGEYLGRFVKYGESMGKFLKME
jgi:hypothetical protein